MSFRRRWARAAFAAIAGFAASAGAAHAQLASGGGPISYSADTLDYLDNNRQLILRGNVDVTQGEARLQANQLTLFFASANGQNTGDIERIVADGDVHYVRPRQVARGDRAIYETKADTVTFTGNVVVTSDENVIRGSQLVLQISTGRTTMRNTTRAGARVQGVLRPQNSGEDAAQPAPPPARPPAARPPAAPARSPAPAPAGAAAPPPTAGR